MVFPYVEEHKFFCDYWFLTRWWNKLREFGALLARHGYLEDGEDVFQLGRHEVASALDELVLTWATGGRAARPPPLAADRRPAQGAAREARRLDPAARARRDPRGGDRSDDDHALGRHDATRAGMGARGRGRSELLRCRGVTGVIEGPARVVKTVDQIADVREGEILVCTITSPAWAPIFSKISAAVTDIGGVMSHAAIVCREYGLPAVVGTGRATSQIRTGQMVRVDGSTGVVTILAGGEDGGVSRAARTPALAELRRADELRLRRQERQPR